jgi:hypothetical protein
VDVVLDVVPGQVGLDHMIHPHLDAAPPVLLLVRYSVGIGERQPRKAPPTRQIGPSSPVPASRLQALNRADPPPVVRGHTKHFPIAPQQ